MKQFKLFGSAVVALMLSALLFSGCKEDEVEFLLETLTANGIDLNGATSASAVPADATIVASFSKDVDAASVGDIHIHREYDGAEISASVTVSGSTINIDPDVDFGNGTLYELHLGGIKSTDGDVLADITRTFTTEGSFVPVGQIAYWNFEDNATDQVGGRTPSAIVDLTYETSLNAAAGKAASFNGTTTIVEFANGDELMNTDNFSISFWVKAVSTNHAGRGHFVFGLGAFYGFQFEIPGDYGSCKLAARYDLGDGTTASEDLWFAGDGNLGWQGWVFCSDLTASGGVAALLQDKWAHVVCVYDATSREGRMYINGTLHKVQDFDLWPDGDPKRNVVGLKYGGVAPEVVNEFALGFIQSRAGTLWDTETWGGYDYTTANHFEGALDNLRIFHEALTETEVQLMYESEN